MPTLAGNRQEATKSRWFVYMVRCVDHSLYTGITTDIARRVAEHNSAKAARYTRARQPVVLVYQEEVASRVAACQREAAIKRLKKRDKEALVADWDMGRGGGPGPGPGPG